MMMSPILRNDFLAPSLFGSIFGDQFFNSRSASMWSPNLNLVELDEQYVVEMEAPGVTRDDLEISVDRGRLVVSGTKRSQREVRNDNEKSFISESYVGSFSRSVQLSDDVDVEQIGATLRNGMLIITIPKGVGNWRRTIEIQ